MRVKWVGMYKYIVTILIINIGFLISCGQSAANISRGIFEINDPPIITPKISQKDTGYTFSAIYSHQMGGEDTVQLLNIENKSVVTYEGSVLQQENADIKYVINSSINTLYLDLTKRVNISNENQSGYLSIHVGILPFGFVGAGYTESIGNFLIGLNSYIGYSVNSGKYSGRFIEEIGGIDGGWDNEYIADNYSTKLGRVNSGLAFNAGYVFNNIFVSYYGGCYFPWLYSSVQYKTEEYGEKTFDLSFDFPNILINQIEISYELSRYILASVSLNQYSSMNYEETIRKVSFEMQIKI